MNANIFAELVKRRLNKYTDSERRDKRKKKENPFWNKRFDCLIFAWRVLFRRSAIVFRAFRARSVSRRDTAHSSQHRLASAWSWFIILIIYRTIFILRLSLDSWRSLYLNLECCANHAMSIWNWLFISMTFCLSFHRRNILFSLQPIFRSYVCSHFPYF